MKNQINKINDVHMVSKILMMEKIVKRQKELEDWEEKRSINYRIRAQRNRAKM